jgi:hypothetical protein
MVKCTVTIYHYNSNIQSFISYYDQQRRKLVTQTNYIPGQHDSSIYIKVNPSLNILDITFIHPFNKVHIYYRLYIQPPHRLYIQPPHRLYIQPPHRLTS